jgi:hypothetical protein
MNQRSAALLTKSQRQGLLHGLGTSSSERKLQQRIRKRTRDSTTDLRLLFSQLEDGDIEDAFQADLTPLKKATQHLQEAREIAFDVSQDMARGSSISEDIYDMMEEYGEIANQLQDLEDDYEDITDESAAQFTERELNEVREETRMDIQEAEDQLYFIQQDIVKACSHLREEIDEWRRDLDEILNHIQQIDSLSSYLQLVPRDDYNDVVEILSEFRSDHEDMRRELDAYQEALEKVENRIDNEDEFSDSPIGLRLDTDIKEITRKLKDYSDTYDRLRRRHGRDKYSITSVIDRLQQYIHNQSFSPAMRDNVVKSIGFYLRVADVVDADMERLLEDAVTATVGVHHSEEVLDQVSVDIRTQSRDRARKIGRKRLGKQRLSNAELRALAESDAELFSEFDGSVEYSRHDQIVQRVLSQPNQLGPGFEFLEIEPTIEYQDLEVTADLLGEDVEGHSVLVEVAADPSDDFGDEIDRMKILLDSFEQSDSVVRGVILVPGHLIETKKPQPTIDRIDVIGV